MTAPTAPAVSIVMSAYNMARVLPRTLRSLAPPHQAMPPGGLEVIVVDNGSAAPLCAAAFRDLELAVTVLRIDPAPPSPVRAMNQGLAAATGTVIGAWIDGARMASPGLVAKAAAVCTRARSDIAAGINYYLGDKPQYLQTPETYDERVEDALLSSIDWPNAGYRLFEIAAPAPLSGLDGPMLESNALFMHRSRWDELGGYDERFVTPGGGGCNPDVLTRAAALPGARVVKISGEGTFHQIHGGITSNAKAVGTVIKEMGRDYFNTTGRPLAALRKGMIWSDELAS